MGRFEASWATADLIKQFLRNRRKYDIRKGYSLPCSRLRQHGHSAVAGAAVPQAIAGVGAAPDAQVGLQPIAGPSTITGGHVGLQPIQGLPAVTGPQAAGTDGTVASTINALAGTETD